MPIQEATTSLRDDLSQAFEEHAPAETVAEVPAESVEKTAEERVRDEKGRFVEKAVEPVEKPVVEAPVVQRPPRPQAWKKDFEKDWETLDPRLASYINQREQEYHKGVSTYKSEWDRAKPILDALGPYAPMLQQYNVRPEQLIQNMFTRHQVLTTSDPQTKLQAWLQLGRDYGVPMQMLQQQSGQQPNPYVQWTQQQLAQMRGEMQQWRSQQEQQQAAQIQKEIESFSSNGEHPHYEVLKETMADILEKGLATTLGDAYKIAMRMPQHDDILTGVMEGKRKAEELQRAQAAKQAVANARSKAVSLKSSSPGAPEPKKDKSLREEIAENVESVLGGARV